MTPPLCSGRDLGCSTLPGRDAVISDRNFCSIVLPPRLAPPWTESRRRRASKRVQAGRLPSAETFTKTLAEQSSTRNSLSPQYGFLDRGFRGYRSVALNVLQTPLPQGLSSLRVVSDDCPTTSSLPRVPT